MMQRNILVFTALLLIFLAIILRTTLPIYLCIFLISVLFFSYLLRVKIDVEPSIVTEKQDWFMNEEIKINLMIKNHGTDGVFNVNLIADRIFTVKQEQNVVRIRSGETGKVEVKLIAKIPVRTTKFMLKITTSDPLGFFRFEKSVEMPVNIRILPQIEDVRKAGLKPVHTLGLVGNVTSNFRGSGMDFHSLRDYQTGDQLKSIHWKASARYGKLIAKQFNAERSGDVIVCVDLRKSACPLEKREEMQARMISAAFSVATKVVNNRDRVGAVVISDAVRYIMPGYGKKQIYRILELLLLRRGEGDAPVENVGFILPRLFRTTALFIIFTPMLDDALPRILVDVANRGFKIVCISPDPLSYLPQSKSMEDQIAMGVLGLKRKSLIAVSSRHMEILNWPRHVMLASVLRGLRTYRERIAY
jgi:uncharacterized protein (DUF58 family)